MKERKQARKEGGKEGVKERKEQIENPYLCQVSNYDWLDSTPTILGLPILITSRLNIDLEYFMCIDILNCVTLFLSTRAVVLPPHLTKVSNELFILCTRVESLLKIDIVEFIINFKKSNEVLLYNLSPWIEWNSKLNNKLWKKKKVRKKETKITGRFFVFNLARPQSHCILWSAFSFDHAVDLKKIDISDPIHHDHDRITYGYKWGLF